MALAQSLVDEVTQAGDTQTTAADAALAYSRIARAVRMTVALEERLSDEAAQCIEHRLDQDQTQTRQAAKDHALALRQRRIHASAVIEQTLDDLHTCDDEGAPRFEVEPLSDTYREWLRDDLEIERFEGLSPEEILAQACQAMGLAPDLAAWHEGRFDDAVRLAIHQALGADPPDLNPRPLYPPNLEPPPWAGVARVPEVAVPS